MKRSLLLFTLLSGLAIAGGKGVPIPVEPVVPMPIEESGAFYVGLGLIATDFDYCSALECNYQDSTYGIMLRAGYEFNEYIAVEARGFNTFMDEGPYGGVPLQGIGAYIVPQYTFADNFKVYGLIGYAYTESLAEGNRLQYFEDDSGFSAGGGLEYMITDTYSVFVDYNNLLISSDNDVPSMEAYSLGIKYTF